MRIVIAHPAPLVRDLIAVAFAEVPDVDVVAVVESVGELQTRCRIDSPDVVLAGASFPGTPLGEALPGLLSRGSRVLVVCEVGDLQVAHALLFAGAAGCLLLEDAALPNVVAAVRDVGAGHAALHPAAAAAVLQHWRAARDPDTDSGSRTLTVTLTRRERQVLEGLARGAPTRDIGRDLAISPKTIEAHIGRLLAKLGARNRVQAVSIALDRGLIVAMDSE